MADFAPERTHFGRAGTQRRRSSRSYGLICAAVVPLDLTSERSITDGSGALLSGTLWGCQRVDGWVGASQKVGAAAWCHP
jgi:hypothetical protein